MVRDAEHPDIPQLCGLISDFYAEAPYKTPLIDPEKTAHVLRAYINAPREQSFIKVIDHEGFLAGAMIAERVPDLWSLATKAVEVMLYVRPPFRGRPSAGKLVMSFAKWVEQSPCVVRLEASSGITDEGASQVFEKLGWEYRGTIHGAEAY